MIIIFSYNALYTGGLRPFGSKPAELERHPCLWSYRPSGFNLTGRKLSVQPKFFCPE